MVDLIGEMSMLHSSKKKKLLGLIPKLQLLVLNVKRKSCRLLMSSEVLLFLGPIRFPSVIILSWSIRIFTDHNPALGNLKLGKSTRKSAFGRIQFPNTIEFDSILANHNNFKPSSSSLVHVQPVLNSNQARCSRCLAQSHTRSSCRNAIKCLACHGWGHVEANCFTTLSSKGKGPMPASSVLVAQSPRSSWFRKQPSGPFTSRPPIFRSFGDLAAAMNLQGHSLLPRQPVIVNWNDPSASEAGQAGLEEQPVSCSLSLGDVFSSQRVPDINQVPAHDHPENPCSPADLPHYNQLAQSNSPSTRAYQRADPGPFVPNGMHRINVSGRVPMVRAVATSRPQRRNETVAIVTFDPLPGIALQFPTVREILEEFFEERNVAFSDIQPSHLGQALVCFNSPIDRDALIINSPMPMGNVHVSFTRHNRGRNWRRVNFNHECWLMLMGFPLDYWQTDYIQDAICSFGKVDNWINNRSRLTRLLVRARVADLQSIPQWIVYSDGLGNSLDS